MFRIRQWIELGLSALHQRSSLCLIFDLNMYRGGIVKIWVEGAGVRADREQEA